VVGEVNGGVKKGGGDTTGGDLFGDLELASNALGVCDAACEGAIRHAKTVKRGGKLLFEQQVIQLKINRMFMLTEALRSFVMRIAWEHDAKIHTTNPGLAMNFSTDVIQEVTQLNLDIHGRGALAESGADKLARDAVIWTHLAGDTVQRMRVARRLASPPGDSRQSASETGTID
jgi:alkylation response protein AidB-like acyl-CoA dehydrogenase